jgi:hypothetical protein
MSLIKYNCVLTYFTRKRNQAYGVTVFLVILSVVSWMIVYIVPSNESKMYGIRTLQAIAAIGYVVWYVFVVIMILTKGSHFIKKL